jgi:hypothetical protein
MTTPQNTETDVLFTPSSAEDLFAQCPTFNILVLGNPESTKVELFSKLFGVDLEKVSYPHVLQKL